MTPAQKRKHEAAKRRPFYQALARYDRQTNIDKRNGKLEFEIECTKLRMMHLTDPAARERCWEDIDSLRQDQIELYRLRREDTGADLAVAKGKAAKTAMEMCSEMLAHFPDLTTAELHAGLLHLKGGLSWGRMQAVCGCSRATLKKRVDAYYSKTGLTRPDRTDGIGKKYRLDENRDTNDNKPRTAKRTANADG
jgi:hypothetical protein